MDNDVNLELVFGGLESTAELEILITHEKVQINFSTAISNTDVPALLNNLGTKKLHVTTQITATDNTVDLSINAMNLEQLRVTFFGVEKEVDKAITVQCNSHIFKVTAHVKDVKVLDQHSESANASNSGTEEENEKAKFHITIDTLDELVISLPHVVIWL